MINPLTSAILVLLTLVTITAWLLALRRFRLAPSDAAPALLKTQNRLVLTVSIVAAILFFVRWGVSSTLLQPLTSHVDGLLMVGALLAFAIWQFQIRPKLRGLAVFALPVLTLMFAWGICASTWSYKAFNIEQLKTIWLPIHLVGVYLGTLFAAIAAVTGAMYLFIHKRLKLKTPDKLKSLGNFASLETLEHIIIYTATAGFVLFTIGLVTGLVIISMHLKDIQADDAFLWLLPKITLALIAWMLYAVLMNVRYAVSFRGVRAAWLSIFGFILLLAVYGIVTVQSSASPMPKENTTTDVTTAYVLPTNSWLGGE